MRTKSLLSLVLLLTVTTSMAFSGDGWEKKPPKWHEIPPFPTPTPEPATHVLSVGVRDAKSDHGGDINAQRVRDAFVQFSSVKTAQVLPLTIGGIIDNRVALETMVDSMKAKVRPGDTFIFFIDCHGGFDFFGDETLVWAQASVLSFDFRVPTTGDEYFGLSRGDPAENINDDDFSQLFLDDTWEEVDKLFIISSCYSGGFWGDTIEGDTGDLARLHKTALIAASKESDFTYTLPDSETGLYLGNLGTALVATLEELKEQDSITYQELFNGLIHQGSIFEGSNGYILDFEDNWGVEVPVTFELFGAATEDFELTLGVPEPSSIVLLVLGAVMIGFGRFLRRRSNKA